MNAPVPPVVNLFDLSGRTAVVTGASGGIGAVIARRFAEAGASVVCHYNNCKEAGERVAAAIVNANGKAIAVQADISNEDHVKHLLRQTADAFGGVDILINNAGVQSSEPLRTVSQADWNVMMAANVTGPFLLIRTLAGYLQKADRAGTIVNISSIEGHNPAPVHGHYATSKAALLMLTKAAALEFGPFNIRVNSISPGLIHRDGIRTDWPAGVARWEAAAALTRLGQPHDVADAALFLASDAARWITGTDLVVDGGVSAKSTW